MASRGRLISGSTSKKCLRLWSVSGVSELALPGNNDVTNANVEVEDEVALDGFVTALMFDDALDLVCVVTIISDYHPSEVKLRFYDVIIFQGVVGTNIGTLWYVNWTDQSTVCLVTTNPTDILAVEFSGDDRFVTCANDGSLRLWSLADREQVMQLQVPNQVCNQYLFS